MYFGYILYFSPSLSLRSKTLQISFYYSFNIDFTDWIFIYFQILMVWDWIHKTNNNACKFWNIFKFLFMK